ncbi:MAG: GerMN domain-containing protein [Acidobacteriales bacterium]|nr:GerMN domain-containing protein [Terriglobales bacterium]
MISRQLQITIALLLIALLAGGVYMYELRRRDERNLLQSADARPVTAPVAGPKVPVTLVVAFDDDGVLMRRQAEVALPDDPSGRAREVLRALLAEYLQHPAPHKVGEGADVDAVYLVEGGLCVVDMNAKFATGHPSGVLLEQFTVATMIETLAVNIPGVRRVKFLVEGKERETLAGHADLTTMYDVDAVHQIVTGLEKH